MNDRKEKPIASMLLAAYGIVLAVLAVFSYAFVDRNLPLTGNAGILPLVVRLQFLTYEARPVAASIFFGVLVALTALYVRMLRTVNARTGNLKMLLAGMFLFGILSFPALSYDIFNYMTTSRVLYLHGENPYVVMPVEIPNEPYLAFTRAANKVALYGPTWLLLTAVPYVLGGGGIWQTILAYKLMSAAGYIAMCFIIWRITGDKRNVVFFALNPLVVMETLVSSHNDIYMMVLAVSGLSLMRKRETGLAVSGIVALLASVFVKGPTILLFPVWWLTRKFPREILYRASFWTMLVFMFVAAPLREELYPWYALWPLAFASLLPVERNRFLWGLCIVLSFGLELRHIPYMYTGSYTGYGPVLRTAAVAVPVVSYLAYSLVPYLWRKRNSTH